MIRIAILGSTGSIGRSTLDVVADQPGRLAVVGLAARSRIELLEEQIASAKPRLVAVLDRERAAALRRRLVGSPAGADLSSPKAWSAGAPTRVATPSPKAWSPSGVRVLEGQEGMIELVTHPDVDVVLVGSSGREALVPVIRAIEAGKRIALASKELLVMAGELIMRLVNERGTTLMPVDSEHAALFQALQGVPREQVSKLMVTGTGGPLWPLSMDQLARVTREQVLAHPKWQMGRKITVDSATLMNKGLEVIEAHWLFGMPLDRIEVLIHPQALIHAIIELYDGSCLAQMSVCDMRLPIQSALSYPERWPMSLPRIRWTELGGLQFFLPDTRRFPCLALAWEAAKIGGTACTALSVANEVAVGAYLQDRLEFGQIPRVIAETLRQHRAVAHPSLEDILAVEEWSRQAAEALIERRPAVVAG